MCTIDTYNSKTKASHRGPHDSQTMDTTGYIDPINEDDRFDDDILDIAGEFGVHLKELPITLSHEHAVALRDACHAVAKDALGNFMRCKIHEAKERSTIAWPISLAMRITRKKINEILSIYNDVAEGSLKPFNGDESFKFLADKGKAFIALQKEAIKNQ